jgi:uncharacterized damage-inducible protein DinB
MSNAPDGGLLGAVLDSWDRNNRITVNLLRALPPESLGLRAVDGSPTVAEMFTHMHYCRVVSVFENAPEIEGGKPHNEWADERDPDRIAALLDESAGMMRKAVESRLASGRPMERQYDHPILMLQHFIWHEGYHQGQIKLALKRAGRPFDDEEIGPLTWDVWMDKEGTVRFTPLAPSVG